MQTIRCPHWHLPMLLTVCALPSIVAAQAPQSSTSVKKDEGLRPNSALEAPEVTPRLSLVPSRYRLDDPRAALEADSCRLAPSVFGTADICRNYWVRGEALVWHRNRSESIPVSGLVDDVSGETMLLLTTKQADFDNKGGFRLTLGGRVGPLTELEVTYLGIYDWSAHSGTADAGGALESPFLGFTTSTGPKAHPFDEADEHSINYISGINGVELTWRRKLLVAPKSDVAVLIGPRFISFVEDFELGAIDNDLAGAGPASGLYATKTVNNMLGAQLGTGLTYEPFCGTVIEMRGLVGMLMNLAHQDSVVSTQMPAPLANTHSISGDNAEAVALLVESGLSASCRVHPNIELRGGYQFLYLSGLALAAEQLDFSQQGVGSTVLNDSGSVFYHGPWMGLQVAW